MRIHKGHLLCVIAGALLAIRLYPVINVPRFWAEDGVVFWTQWNEYGISSFWTAYAGYLHLFPRLISALAGVLPLEWTATVYVWASIAVTMWTCLTIYSVIGRWAGLIVALSPLVASGWTEILGTPTNLQWITACGLVAISFSEIRSRGIYINALLFVCLSCLSGPFSTLFIPIFAVRAFISGKKGEHLNAGLFTLAVVLGSIQAFVVATSEGEPAATAVKGSPLDALWPMLNLLFLSTANFLATIPILVIAAVSLLNGERRWERLVLACAMGAIIVSVGVKFINMPHILDGGHVGQRYWYVPSVLWFFVAGSLILEKERWLSKVGVALLVILIVSQDWHTIAKPDKGPVESWPDKVRASTIAPVEYHFPPGWKIVIDQRKQ